MKKPTKPCICGSNDWWQRADREWLCSKCHPNPNPGSNPEPPDAGRETMKNEEELEALKSRIRQGNEKLNKAWLQIKEIEGEEREKQVERWLQANEKLRALCDTLESLEYGFRDCLYIVDGRKTKSCLNEPSGWLCQVCPCSSDKNYWGKELFGGSDEAANQ